MSSVAPVLASSNRSDSDYRSTVHPTQSGTAHLVPAAEASKKTVTPLATAPPPAAQNAATAATKQTTLPLTMLLSVNQPANSNAQATMDYQVMQSDLRWGNLSAAQEVYNRLQSDLLLNREPAGSSKAGASTEAASTEATAANQKNQPHANGELNTTA